MPALWCPEQCSNADVHRRGPAGEFALTKKGLTPVSPLVFGTKFSAGSNYLCEPPPLPEECPELPEEMWPMEEVAAEPCGSPNPEYDLFGELAANCGAGCTCTNPDFVTCWLRWFRLPMEPRGIPNPAEPACTVYRAPLVKEAVVAAFPMRTVLVVPAAGATNGVTWTKVVGRYMGIGCHVFHPPGCQPHPYPGTNIHDP